MPSSTQEVDRLQISERDDIKDAVARDKIEKAIVSLKLEGITLSKESLNDLAAFANGKISRQESLRRVVNRAKATTKRSIRIS